MSEHRRHVNWNQVLWGLSLQFLLALFVLRTKFGKELFKCFGDKVTEFLGFTDDGSSFLFGYLVHGNLANVTIHDVNMQLTVPAVFAFKVG